MTFEKELLNTTYQIRMGNLLILQKLGKASPAIHIWPN